MKSIIKSSILLIALTSTGIFTAGAQQTTPDPAAPPLDKRVEKLEGDIGQILQILKSQQTQSTTPAKSATPPSTVPSPSNSPAQAASLKPGAILELWILKPDFSGDAPAGRSIGGMIDQGDYFTLTNFTEEPSLANQQSNRIALRWSGFFKAKEAGPHVFTVEWSKPKGNMINSDITAFWTADLSIDQQSLLKGAPQVFRPYRDNDVAFSDSAEVQLDPGFYPLSLFTFMSSSGRLPTEGWSYAKMKLNIKVRGPSDMTPRTITSKDLFHKE
jgi:hypothetical protein